MPARAPLLTVRVVEPGDLAAAAAHQPEEGLDGAISVEHARILPKIHTMPTPPTDLVYYRGLREDPAPAILDRIRGAFPDAVPVRGTGGGASV